MYLGSNAAVVKNQESLYALGGVGIENHSLIFTHTRNGTGRYLVWTAVRADATLGVGGTHE